MIWKTKKYWKIQKKEKLKKYGKPKSGKPKKRKKKKEKRNNVKNGQFSIRNDQDTIGLRMGIQDTGEFRDLQSV